MKARLQSRLPSGDGWAYELKLDGIRAVVVKDGDHVQLFSRLPREITSEYPHLVATIRKLAPPQLVADGEIVVLDDEGRPSFQLLQNRRSQIGASEVLLYLFDLMHLNGRDLRGLPLVQRKVLLEKLLSGRKPVGSAATTLRYSASLQAPPELIWREVLQRRLEGVIAKQENSPYEAGQRSGAWVKVKTHAEQEFVIGGYTPPEGSRKFFGSLIVGYYQGSELHYASRVGSGFDFQALQSLHRQFQPLRVAACPFANLPTQRAGRWGQGMTAAEMKRCVWLKPALVCQVRFQEWTKDGNLRQPVFVGLRADKRPQEVKREG
jgi:bifunctional non-homologous end joining protein LigD